MEEVVNPERVSGVDSGMASGFLAKVKAAVGEPTVWLPEVAMYGGISFCVGFLFKNFGKYIIGCFVLISVALVVIHYTGITAINVNQITDFLGISSLDFSSPRLVVDAKIAWIKAHIMATVSIVAGFILGWKVG